MRPQQQNYDILLSPCAQQLFNNFSFNEQNNQLQNNMHQLNSPSYTGLNNDKIKTSMQNFSINPHDQQILSPPFEQCFSSSFLNPVNQHKKDDSLSSDEEDIQYYDWNEIHSNDNSIQQSEIEPKHEESHCQELMAHPNTTQIEDQILQQNVEPKLTEDLSTKLSPSHQKSQQHSNSIKNSQLNSQQNINNSPQNCIYSIVTPNKPTLTTLSQTIQSSNTYNIASSNTLQQDQDNKMNQNNKQFEIKGIDYDKKKNEKQENPTKNQEIETEKEFQKELQYKKTVIVKCLKQETIKERKIIIGKVRKIINSSSCENITNLQLNQQLDTKQQQMNKQVNTNTNFFNSIPLISQTSLSDNPSNQTQNMLNYSPINSNPQERITQTSSFPSLSSIHFSGQSKNQLNNQPILQQSQTQQNMQYYNSVSNITSAQSSNPSSQNILQSSSQQISQVQSHNAPNNKIKRIIIPHSSNSLSPKLAKTKVINIQNKQQQQEILYSPSQCDKKVVNTQFQ